MLKAVPEGTAHGGTARAVAQYGAPAPSGMRSRAPFAAGPGDADASLVDRIRELEAALRARDEFLAVLAHELRNPLAPIRNVAQVVRALAKSDHDLIKVSDVLERQVG